ncbi:unnamed protein product [Ilex paraguariensis]|uniref:Uncharacterized protein n=1 Tax=Ilex paraguariensis TaxID=185542 RepID=A0ABC8RY48_9AQUA
MNEGLWHYVVLGQNTHRTSTISMLVDSSCENFKPRIAKVETIFPRNFLSIDFYPSFNKMPLLTQSVFTFILKVEAMVDKTICALSTVFIRSSGSTFTEDILRLRKDWGSASPCDEYLSRGEVPNFITDDK